MGTGADNAEKGIQHRCLVSWTQVVKLMRYWRLSMLIIDEMTLSIWLAF